MADPVLIVGMHRSGTGLLAEGLERLGLFTGARKQADHEALFFLRLNDWILRAAGGSWERPGAVDDLIANDALRGRTVDYLARMLRSPRAASFLGTRAWLRHGSPARLPGAWGWKDPRTTFTLPLWLELFPAARVIHIHRHGVAVAGSLKRRQEDAWSDAERRDRRRRLLYWLWPKRGGFAATVRGLSLAGGFDLWDEYLERARRHVAARGERAIEIGYEELLANPTQELLRAAAFAGLAPDEAPLARVAEDVRAERANAWEDDPELADFSWSVAERLAARGYPAADRRSAAKRSACPSSV